MDALCFYTVMIDYRALFRVNLGIEDREFDCVLWSLEMTELHMVLAEGGGGQGEWNGAGVIEFRVVMVDRRLVKLWSFGFGFTGMNEAKKKEGNANFTAWR